MFRRSTLAAVLLLFFCSLILAAEPPEAPSVDGGRAKGYVTYLASDGMMGRQSCTEGYRRAADWVAGRFAAWGLKSAGEDGTYFQNVAIRSFTWNTGVPELKVGDRPFSVDDRDFALDSCSRAGVTVVAEVVFVGYGIAAPAKGLDEYEGVDVKGKVVLVLRGSPHKAPKAAGRFAPREDEAEEEKEDPWKEESTDLAKIRVAYEKGAAAVLLYDPDESSETGGRRRGPRRSAASSFQPERDFLCFAVGERVVRAILKRDPQESPGGLKRRIDAMRRAIKGKEAQSFATHVPVTLKGYDTSTRIDEEHGNNIARNVLAKIEGTDPELKKEYILAGAHLDHIGMRNGYVYNGADDNASGSAVVLEVARTLAQTDFQPKRTLVFCCWGGEEMGLIGSRHYTSNPCDGVTMDQVAVYFNLDMVGLGAELNAPGALNFPEIWEVIRHDQDPEILKRVKPRTGGPGGSDHSGFITRGIEALALMTGGGGGHPDYHQPEDDSQKIDPNMLQLTGQFVLQGMMNLANETEVDLLVDRREAIYRSIRLSVANLNPDLKDSQWTRVSLKGKTKEGLEKEIYDRARELLRKPASGGENRPLQRSITRGLVDYGVVADDEKLLKLVLDFHGIGRIDVQGDDGVWVVDGRLTDAGREALKMMESENLVIRFVSPGEELLNDMLSAASKPFVVTGDYQVTPSMAPRLNYRGVLLGVNLDLRDVNAFIARVEELKSLLGERRNLFAYLVNAEGLEKARRPLYLRLLDKGWAHNEIAGFRDHRGLLNGATLHSLGQTNAD